MPRIQIATVINAPIERCFDLARDIGFHQRSLVHTGERAIGGVTSGMIELGETVTWEATHFGVRQRLTVRITAYDRPHSFVDEMTRGAFARFTHRHTFVAVADGTLMGDDFDYTAPLGPLGKIADRLFLERYMRQLLLTRNRELKRVAEQLTKQEPR
ncbi:MAG TPA: SRPBCC family protein [Thermomicrobiales bacterium]|jgi:ligand-binding SRPBCC domain-containing protein